MTRISQKNREQDFLEQFKRLYPDFPKGTIIPGEDPPDFLVENKYQRIAFEITELYPEANNEEICFDKRLELERDILKKASQIFEKSSDLNFNVIAQFKPKFIISKSHKEVIAKGICDAILNEMFQNQSINKYFIIKDSKLLPKEVEDIRIIIQSKNSIPIWQSGHGSQIRELTLNELSNRIVSKENSFVKGANYNEQWLLIAEPYDKLTYYDIPDFTNFSVNSSFHKIFILRCLYGTIREVKI